MKIEHGKIWCNMKTKFENIHALEIWQQTNSEKYVKSGITTNTTERGKALVNQMQSLFSAALLN